MLRRTVLFTFALVALTSTAVRAQLNPYYNWTFLPAGVMDEIIGEASGETAWNTIMETGGYNKDRLSEEYAGTFYESQYIYDQLVRYGVPGAEIVRYPGGRVWDAVVGELWETHPMRQNLASYRDMTAMLAKGSGSADVNAQLVWVGNGTAEELDAADIDGTIVVTEGSIGSVYRSAVQNGGALGVVCIMNSRPLFDPLQIPWSSVGGRGSSSGDAGFGFFIPPREGQVLKRRLMAGEEITVHARVETTTVPYELQDPVCHIPGTDPDAGEIILTAHLFEGITKQGACDNKSGSAGILEVARVLNTLIEEGRIPRPKRTIRFLWGPEFSGTGPWVRENSDLMERTLCNINMDMVGEWLSLNQAFMCVMRTTFGNAHYINDVMENCYRFVGESSRERIQNRSGFYKVPRRIVAPTGADEPFYYAIETHYGSSDHEVFNNPGVQVPGIMMIAWPDRWYHTSGDRVDKADPTQMKRVAVIGAAAAYTIASADDDLAIRIAGETASNGTRRLGHQFVIAQERLNAAAGGDLAEAYKAARWLIEAHILNEAETLGSILELAEDTERVGSYIEEMQGMIETVGGAHLEALETHMGSVAARLGTGPVRVQLSDLERRASRIVPRQTARVTENGYGGYSDFIEAVPEAERARFPYGRRDIASTSELICLVNGSYSVLDLKKALDAQYQSPSDLQAILNYLEVLRLAGLVEY